ncbi:MAG: hypothetical protein IIU83_01635 [Fibrobacteraceae bacterium]|nr:hypothetical protein [Fibrobacteraceae bacterium]
MQESGLVYDIISKPVGLLKPNGYGLYDVFGLVEEFVLFFSFLGFSFSGNENLPSRTQPLAPGSHSLLRFKQKVPERFLHS